MEFIQGNNVLLDPNLKLFDEISVSDSDISVLSDPFTDEEYEEKQPQLYDLIGRDVYSVFNFSPTLKNIVEKIGPHVDGIKTMMAENPDQIRAKNVFTQVKKRVPLMAQLKIVNLLSDRDIAFGEDAVMEPAFEPDEKKTWEDLKNEVFPSRSILKNIRRLTETEKVRKIKKAQADLEAYETMSGYWRLLDGYENFTISPPGYDSYGGPNRHWLETDQIPYKVLENSRNKVLAWLAKYFKSY